jgi:predicted RNA binding protein YcfA (HicA-like mRNA interferase family)
MPKKIRELKAMLRKAGFISRSGKGSHTIWRHSLFSSMKITLSGADGADAHPYQAHRIYSGSNAPGTLRNFVGG